MTPRNTTASFSHERARSALEEAGRRIRELGAELAIAREAMWIEIPSAGIAYGRLSARRDERGAFVVAIFHDPLVVEHVPANMLPRLADLTVFVGERSEWLARRNPRGRLVSPRIADVTLAAAVLGALTALERELRSVAAAATARSFAVVSPAGLIRLRRAAVWHGPKRPVWAPARA